MLHNGGQESAVGPKPAKELRFRASGNELSAAAQGRLEQIQFFASELAVGK